MDHMRRKFLCIHFVSFAYLSYNCIFFLCFSTLLFNEFSSLKYLESTANLGVCYVIGKNLHIDAMEKSFIVAFLVQSVGIYTLTLNV